jgi:UDP-2,3-diacylglucosamine pyrophosphatase LpxH
MTELQLISDVHLDTRPQWDDAWKHLLENIVLGPQRKKSVLIIAGDVAPYAHAKYRDFLDELTHEYPNVVYTPGNHEFYGAPGPVYETTLNIERVCATLNTNVVVLRSGGMHYDIPGTKTRIIGATLWTNVPDNMWPNAKGLLNDYAYIQGSSGGTITTDDVNDMHNTDKRWLSQSLSLATKEDKTAIVVTHHSPERRLSLYNETRTMSGLGPLYFSSDMGHILSNKVICAWCYGHTHESHCMALPEYKYKFITNAYGYQGERTGFTIASGIKIY